MVFLVVKVQAQDLVLEEPVVDLERAPADQPARPHPARHRRPSALGEPEEADDDREPPAGVEEPVGDEPTSEVEPS